MTPTEKDELPLEVPAGVRLAWDDRGTERPVRVYRNRPCTAAGEIPKAPKARRARVKDPEQPAGGVTILVYSEQAHADEAVAVVNLLTLKGYAAQSRIERKEEAYAD